MGKLVKGLFEEWYVRPYIRKQGIPHITIGCVDDSGFWWVAAGVACRTVRGKITYQVSRSPEGTHMQSPKRTVILLGVLLGGPKRQPPPGLGQTWYSYSYSP